MRRNITLTAGLMGALLAWQGGDVPYAAAPQGPSQLTPVPAEIQRLTLDTTGLNLRRVTVPVRYDLQRLYRLTSYDPLWVDPSGRPGPASGDGLRAIAAAEEHGLDPAQYGLRELEGLFGALQNPVVETPTLVARFDVGLSLGLLRLYRHVHLGRVDPQAVGFHVDRPDHTHDFATLVQTAASEGRVLDLVTTLAPSLAQYVDLQKALARYRTLATDAALDAEVSGTPIVRPGDGYEQLPSLRSKLLALGDLSDTSGLPDERYGEPYVGAVRHFQRRHGLDPDGLVGPRTAAALSVPIGWRVRQIELSLERLRWLPQLHPARLIVVNIPMFRLWAWEALPGQPVLAMDVIVGRALDRQTPVFVDTMERIVFRPYWNVPLSIVRREILPALRVDPDHLDRERLEIVSGPASASAGGGPTTETLEALQRGTVRLRQRPGPDNALGLVKFDFPNVHDIYMHATPQPDLFGEARRDFSHGCIRVEMPVALAEWALSGQLGWSRERIRDAMDGEDDQRVMLDRPIQVVLFYLTAAVVPETGDLHLAEDIYGHDSRLDEGLDTHSEDTEAFLADW